MYRKVLISGVTAAAILGAGGTALAVTGSNTTDGTQAASSSTSSQAHKHKQRHGDREMRRVEHGQLVLRGKDGKTTTVDLIRGTVTAVSSDSITVQAADKTSETYAVNKDTKVRVRADGRGTASSIASVKDGDHVFVTGTGTTSYTAKRVIDVQGAKKK